MKFNDEEEIEDWYEAEKKKLENEFYKGIEKDREDISKAKGKYNSEMKELINNYQQEHEKLMQQKKK